MLSDLQEKNVNLPTKNTTKEWLMNNHVFYRSKAMALFDKKIEDDCDDEVSHAENDYGSVATTLDPLLRLFKRERFESTFSYGMADILRSGHSKAPTNVSHFDFEVGNLMDFFEIGKLYLNDGLYAVTDEFFMDNDDDNDHLLPLCIRIEELKLYIPVDKILRILNNSTITVLKGEVKMVSIKTQPSRRIYGICCLVNVNSMFTVQSLIGVAEDPTFGHSIRQDFTFKCSTVKLSHRVKIGSIQ